MGNVSGPLAIRAKLSEIMPAIRTVLPKHLDAERFERIALTCIRRNPRLGVCTPGSFATAMFQAAEVGLEPNGIDAHLIPYEKKKGSGVFEAQFQTDYKGLMRLARNSEKVKQITCRIVHKNDAFEIEYGFEEKLHHRPNIDNPGDRRGVYAIIDTVAGGRYWVYMTAAEVEKIRQQSKVPNGPLWKNHTDAAWRKTALRQVLKLAPSSYDLQRTVQWDEAGDMGHTPVASEREIDAAFEARDLPPEEEDEEPSPPPPPRPRRASDLEPEDDSPDRGEEDARIDDMGAEAGASSTPTGEDDTQDARTSEARKSPPAASDGDSQDVRFMTKRQCLAEFAQIQPELPGGWIEEAREYGGFGDTQDVKDGKVGQVRSLLEFLRQKVKASGR